MHFALAYVIRLAFLFSASTRRRAAADQLKKITAVLQARIVNNYAEPAGFGGRGGRARTGRARRFEQKPSGCAECRRTGIGLEL